MLSKNSNFELVSFTEKDFSIYTSTRPGENRVGQSLIAENAPVKARYIILGISESIGPMANGGLKGAENAFLSFCSSFLNTQDFQHNCACIGFVKWIGSTTSKEQLTDFVVELDEFVLSVLTKYLRREQVPILIGGGHNNALPLIRWSNLFNDKIDVLNIDAHADCRALEGRHSGNSFSYAIHEGLIKKYHVFGLHRAYLNATSLNYLNENHAGYTFYEDYLDGHRHLSDDIEKLILDQVQNTSIGLEIDMDCIADMPSSAISPSGWRLDQLRSAVRKLANSTLNIAYLHLTEAAPTSDQDKKKVGKALSYLVRDFIGN
jgi:formiminoglutamase